MSLDEDTHRLGDAAERLDARLDDLADAHADAEAGTAGAQEIRRLANEVETQLGGVHHLIDAHGADATVTVAGLDAGMYARVEDRAAATRAQADQPGNLPGARRNIFVAVGLVDAPFLPDDVTTLDAAQAAVSEQPVGVVKWLEARINELTTVDEGNWQRFDERVADRSEGD